jgi:hypothetical protein
LRRKPFSRSSALTATWKVDSKVGNVRNDTADCIEPMVSEGASSQLELDGMENEPPPG